MFCYNCGKENDDDACFCEHCGADLRQSASSTQPASEPVYKYVPNAKPSKPSFHLDEKTKKYAGIAIVVVLVLWLVFSFTGGRSYKKCIDIYFNATQEGDFEKLIEVIPEEVMQKAEEELGEDADKLVENMNYSFEKMMNKLEDEAGGEIKIDYDIQETQDVKGQDWVHLKNKYNQNDIAIEIKEAKVANVDVIVRAGDDEGHGNAEFHLIKVGKKWYIDILNMGSSDFDFDF